MQELGYKTCGCLIRPTIPHGEIKHVLVLVSRRSCYDFLVQVLPVHSCVHASWLCAIGFRNRSSYAKQLKLASKHILTIIDFCLLRLEFSVPSQLSSLQPYSFRLCRYEIASGPFMCHRKLILDQNTRQNRLHFGIGQRLPQA